MVVVMVRDGGDGGGEPHHARGKHGGHRGARGGEAEGEGEGGVLGPQGGGGGGEHQEEEGGGDDGAGGGLGRGPGAWGLTTSDTGMMTALLMAKVR